MKVISRKSKGDIKKILPELKEKLAKKDIKLKKFIAAGKNGYAYYIGGNKVLKITADKSEAKTSSKLIGKKYKHILTIFRVFVFSSEPDIYFIEQEKLEPLKEDEQKIVENMGILSTSDIPEMIESFQRYKKYGTIEEYIKKYGSYPEEASTFDALYYKLGGANFKKKYPLTFYFFCYKIAEDTIDGAIRMFKNVDVMEKALSGIYEMYKKGISYDDGHEGNLLRSKRGVLKWIDLGVESAAPGTVDIKVLQGKRI